MTRGLERLAGAFPWVTGQVSNEGAGIGTSGVFKFAPLEETPRLYVHDLVRDDSAGAEARRCHPTMDGLRQARFPMSMLDESVVAPRSTIPGQGAGWEEKEEAGVWPVFLVQATFIAGGLILTFVGHHGCMDGPGQGQVVRLLSKACAADNDEGRPFTDDELKVGNLDRGGLIPLLRPDEVDIWNSLDMSAQLMDLPTEPSATEPYLSPRCSWAYFVFSGSSLAALKALATSTLPNDGPGYISTDDALTAFIWQSVSRVRLSSASSSLAPGTTTKLARAVDVRRYLAIPAAYPGLVQNMAYHSRLLGELVNDAPLGEIAAELRAAVDVSTSTLAADTRTIATRLHCLPDKGLAASTAPACRPSTDIMLSSWAKLGDCCYDLDFGLGLGGPVAVRRPAFTTVEGLIYLMPRRSQAHQQQDGQVGEIAAALCLSDEDLERLRADAKFMAFAEYVG